MYWLEFFGGTETAVVEAGMRRTYTSLLLRCGIRALGIRNLPDGRIEFCLRRRDMRALEQAALARGLVPPQPEMCRGFPRVLAFLRRRPGVLVGAALAAGLIAASSLFVWRVDIVCLDNAQGAAERDRLDLDEVRRVLSEGGVDVGLFLPSLDVRDVENRILAGQKEISWMAINRSGTVLSVEVRPAHVPDVDRTEALRPEEGYAVGTNLVADGDGRILSFSVQGGQTVVSAEQMVTEGTLLATGMYTSETGDIVGMRVHGEVLAETVRTLCAEIPLVRSSAIPVDVTRREWTLVAFGKPLLHISWPLFDVGEIVTFLQTFRFWDKNAGISGEKYGIITDETILQDPPKAITLWDGVPLPLVLQSATVLQCTEERYVLTEEEAAACAKKVLDGAMAALGAREILSCEESFSYRDDTLYAVRYVYCIDNIAREEEFRIKTDP